MNRGMAVLLLLLLLSAVKRLENIVFREPYNLRVITIIMLHCGR